MDRKEIVAFTAYLIGVPVAKWHSLFGAEYAEMYTLLDKLDVTAVVRILCKLRTKLMQYYVQTNAGLQVHKTFMDMPWFDGREIRKLGCLGLWLPTTSAYDLLVYINQRIDCIIDFTQQYLPNALEWGYYRKLFVYEDYTDLAIQKAEFMKYRDYQLYYPYKMYINFEPKNYGTWFENDLDFLKTLYSMNGDSFEKWAFDLYDYTAITDLVTFALSGFGRLMQH